VERSGTAYVSGGRHDGYRRPPIHDELDGLLDDLDARIAAANSASTALTTLLADPTDSDLWT
jgi:hypothetical protein